MTNTARERQLQRAAAALDHDIDLDVWPELDPLPELVERPPAPFPLHALGEVMGAAALAIANSVRAPDALVAGSVLSAASLAAQPLANVVLPHGQRCPLSLYVITSAQSGDRKSAADAVANRQIEEARKRDARVYAREFQHYEEEKATRKKGAPEPQPPILRTLTTSNATIEGLSRLLKTQSSVGIFSSEGGEVLGGHSLREDRRVAALAFYLKLWGGETVDSLRAGEGLTTLLGRRLAMHVMVQPVLLNKLLLDPLAQGQGLLARCLIAQPETLAGTRLYQVVDPNADPATLRFHSAIRDLLGRKPTCRPDGDSYELTPRNLPLGDDAAKLWIAFYDDVETQQATDRELADMRPFASKAAEHAARIAAVITLLEDPNAERIGLEAMEGAIEATSFYMNEHLRLTGASKAERRANQLLCLWDWLSGQRRPVAHKDVLQSSPRPIRNLRAQGILPLLAELEIRGYIRRRGDVWEVRRVQA